MNRFKSRIVALASTALVGCGGSLSDGLTWAGILSDLITITGYAMKGTLQKAQVDAYVVQKDGTVGAASVASGQTDENGKFILTDKDGKGVSKANRYIIKVTPIAGTNHVDEVKGNQALSAAFELSAVAPVTNVDSVKAGDKITVNLTPFSHQEVKAAAQVPGGLTDTNVAKAKTMTSELYGFDPVQVEQGDKTLKVLLYAVSQMASDGALNCAAVSDKTTCVTTNLAAATSVDTLKLTFNSGAGTVDASTQFKAAINTAVTELAKTDSSISSVTVANTLENLSCTGSDCAVTTPPTGQPTTVASAIAAVKAVLNEMRADLLALFSNDGVDANSKGAFNSEGFKFDTSVRGTRMDTDQASHDLKALWFATQMYRDSKAGVGVYSAGKDLGRLRFWHNNVYSSAPNATGCTLYNDEAGLTPATSAATSNFIACHLRYGGSAIRNADNTSADTTYWGYRIWITPQADGSFAYKARATKTTAVCPLTSGACTTSAVINLQTQVDGSPVKFAGTMTPTLNADGKVEQIVVDGQMPPIFVVSPNATTGLYDGNSVSLSTDSHSRSLSLNARFSKWDDGLEPQRLDVTGMVATMDVSGQKQAKLEIKPGSHWDAVAASFKLDIEAAAYTASNTAVLSGVLTLSDPVTDASGTQTVPSKMAFVGGLSNTPTGGMKTEFLSGTYSVNMRNYDKVDSTMPGSVTNAADLDLTFTGSFTAPGHPRLEVVVAGSGRSVNLGDSLRTLSVSYNRWAGAAKTRAVTMTVKRDSAVEPRTVSVSEASSGLSITHVKGQATKPAVKSHGTTIGELDLDSGRITFSDATFISTNIW